MHHRRLLNSEWNQVEERFKKRLSCWKSKLLSVGGRLVLINSMLSSIPLFMFSMFELPKGVLERLIFIDHVSTGKMRVIRKNTV